jgi:hypothetical protein
MRIILEKALAGKLSVAEIETEATGNVSRAIRDS